MCGGWREKESLVSSAGKDSVDARRRHVYGQAGAETTFSAWCVLVRTEALPVLHLKGYGEKEMAGSGVHKTELGGKALQVAVRVFWVPGANQGRHHADTSVTMGDPCPRERGNAFDVPAGVCVSRVRQCSDLDSGAELLGQL